MAAGLGHEENADEGDEEHEVAAEGEEHADAGLREAFAGTTATLGTVIPTVAVAVTAGAFVCGWATAGAVIALTGAGVMAAVDLGGCENRRHGGPYDAERMREVEKLRTALDYSRCGGMPCSVTEVGFHWGEKV